MKTTWDRKDTAENVAKTVKTASPGNKPAEPTVKKTVYFTRTKEGGWEKTKKQKNRAHVTHGQKKKKHQKGRRINAIQTLSEPGCPTKKRGRRHAVGRSRGEDLRQKGATKGGGTQDVSPTGNALLCDLLHCPRRPKSRSKQAGEKENPYNPRKNTRRRQHWNRGKRCKKGAREGKH